MIRTTQAVHISEAVRETLRVLLKHRVLQRTDGAFDMGYEKCKEDIRISIEACTGMTL